MATSVYTYGSGGDDWNAGKIASEAIIKASDLSRALPANESRFSILEASFDFSDAVEQVGRDGVKVDQSVNHGKNVSQISREEIDAKLELLLARSDARARETELLAEARLSRFEERIDQAIGEMRRDRSEIKDAIGSLKTTTVVTAITAVLAIVFGVAAFNATVLSNMVASFESGKNTASALGDATARLERLQDRIEAAQSARPQPAPPAKK